MNDTLAAFARKSLKDGLARCTERQQAMFKLMYSHPGCLQPRTPAVTADIKAANIEDVVDGMPDDELDRAMEQVEATLARCV